MSNILNLFANGIVNYLLVGSVVAALLTLLAWGIIRVAKIRAPIYRHMIWLYLLMGIVVLPAIWLGGPKLTLAVLPAQVEPLKPEVLETDAGNAVKLVKNTPNETHLPSLTHTRMPVETNPAARAFPIRAVLAGVWLVGVVFVLARLAVGWYRLRRIRLSTEPVSQNERIANVDGQKLRILVTSRVRGPVCFGVLRPVILLPKEMYEKSTEEDLQMVLNHELAHIERRDCLTNLFQRIVEATFFFHPLVLYASSQLTQQREQICDNYVLKKGVPIMDYIKLLSRIAEQGLEKTRFQAVALFEGRLVQRVRSLLDPKHSNQTKVSRRAAVVCAITVLICLMFGTIQLEAKPNRDSDSTNSPVKKYSVVPQREFHPPGLGPRPRGHCSISGKVISAESGEPVGHATVCLSMKAHASIFIEVASDGTFVFKDIPTGPFSLRTMNTAGFQDVYYNPGKRPGRRPKFSLADAEKRVDVVLRVKPACSIAGKILDENGEPLRGRKLYVQAWVELVEPNGQKRYSKVNSKRIASDGSYSLDGLDGRPVYVMAIDWKSEEKDEFYPPCYYPGTVDRNKAKKVSFDETTSVEEVDIRLQKKGDLILEGVVTDEKTGNPIPKALVTVHHRDMLFDYLTTYTDEQGRYRIESIGAGEFLVHVDAEPWGFVRTRKPVEIKAATKTTALGFTLRPGATISGKFVDENGTPIEIAPRAYGLAYRYGYPNPGTESWTGVRNRYGVKRRTGFTTFNGSEGDYEEEYMDFPTPSTFIIEGIIPGKTTLRFRPNTKGQTVKEILYKGENIIETGIETKPGQEIKDVTIVIGVS